MPRPLRIHTPNVWYHVMNRGAGYQKIFRNGKGFRTLKLQIVKSTIFITLIFCQIGPVKAEHVLPVFSGYSYTGATFVGRDSCGAPLYYYEDRQQGSPKEIAEALLNVAPLPGCQWDEISFEKYPFHPDDFVEFSEEDRNKIPTNPNAVLPVFATRNCINIYGNVEYIKSVTVQPSYVCPTGSRLSTDKMDYSQGCTTTPMIGCGADLVGRDLGVTGGGFLGHVALASYSQVIEVLSTPTVPIDGIYTNTLDSFKYFPGNPFWGAKYGLSGKNILTDKETIKILNAAQVQKRYEFEYTNLWDFHPGNNSEQQIYDQQMQQWQTIRAGNKAKFRCDSFIYYVYLAGANLQIFPKFAFPLVPKDMFNAFLFCRDKEGTLCGAKSAINRVYSIAKSAQLKAVFSAPTLNIAQADYTTYQYIHNPHIPRAVKMNELWSLAIKFQYDENKFTYLIDSLDLLKPIELTPELIQQLQTDRHPQNQLHLLYAMSHILEDQPPSKAMLTNDQLLNVVKIQNLIEDQLKTATDRRILRYAIRTYPSIFPPEKAKADIEKALARKEIADLQPPLFSDREKMYINLDIAFSTALQQQKDLPQLMQTHFDENQQTLFHHVLCFWLYDMNPKWIDDSVREILKQFLLRNKSSLLPIRSGLVRRQLSQPNLPVCNWLNAYGTVMTHTKAEREQFIYDYIRNEKDIFTQAVLLTQLTGEQLDHLPEKTKLSYRAKFYKALDEMKKSMTLTREQRLILWDGIDTVNQKELKMILKNRSK